jgi:hypothetical protein
MIKMGMGMNGDLRRRFLPMEGHGQVTTVRFVPRSPSYLWLRWDSEGHSHEMCPVGQKL